MESTYASYGVMSHDQISQALLCLNAIKPGNDQGYYALHVPTCICSCIPLHCTTQCLTENVSLPAAMSYMYIASCRCASKFTLPVVTVNLGNNVVVPAELAVKDIRIYNYSGITCFPHFHHIHTLALKCSGR